MKVRPKHKRNAPLIIEIENDFSPDIDPRGGYWTFEVSAENLQHVETQLPTMDPATTKITCALLLIALRHFVGEQR